ncbi:sigma-54 interaction domain-containing protein [Thalassobacillus devorans]|uniref:sigma-54 interaction domain-containing protein n=1 Tax=Thalassobacillus devorans TaxID=279813 RepID=UPI000A1C7D3B|nr:sigma 54-interacting transcriptional regulator [Thalassobacillus devorans]
MKPIYSEKYNLIYQDLKAVFETSFDVIYVTDGEGMTLRVSASAEKLWGIKPEELVGKTVYEHETNNIFNPSVAKLVLERKEKVQTFQTTKTGRRLLVVGTPIKDDSGEIIRVINTSRDITKEAKLKDEVAGVKRLLEGYRKQLEQIHERERQNHSIIHKSKSMEEVIMLSKKVASVDSTVLITGESGVGKEVIASYIHQNSSRHNKPYIKVNCGAIPRNLLESELFGYEEGAFTGAKKGKKIGVFEASDGGTLFLDEISELPIDLQVKLLRVIQEKEIQRLGGTKPIKINTRILAATNKDLKMKVKEGAFREDLYYRVNVLPINIPPLRDRKEDIPLLALHFLEVFNKKYNTEKRFSQSAIDALYKYDWEGNVRELQNIVERAAVFIEDNEIKDNNLPSDITKNATGQASISIHRLVPLNDARKIVEDKLLELAQEKYKNMYEIAEALGVNQSTVSRKLKKETKKCTGA